MIFQVANKYPPVAESGEGNDEPSQLIQSLIRKNGPESEDYAERSMDWHRKLRFFVVDSPLKKTRRDLAVMSKKGRNFFSQPTSAKETVRVMYLK